MEINNNTVAALNKLVQVPVDVGLDEFLSDYTRALMQHKPDEFTPDAGGRSFAIRHAIKQMGICKKVSEAARKLKSQLNKEWKHLPASSKELVCCFLLLVVCLCLFYLVG